MTLLAIPLEILLFILVAIALTLLARQMGDGIGRWVAWLLRHVPFVGDYAADQAVRFAVYLSDALRDAVAPVLHRAVGWLTAMAHYVARVGYWSLLPMIELWKFQVWLLGTELPRIIRAIPHGIVKVVHGIVKVVHTLERRTVTIVKVIPAKAHAAVVVALPRSWRTFGKELEWLRHHWKGVTAAVAGAAGIAVPFPRIGIRARDWTGVLKRLRRLERRTAGVAAAAMVAAALTRLGLNWLRCRNVTRAGKAACAADPGLWDSLLLDTVAIVGAISVVEFAETLLAVEDEAVAIFGRLIREFPAT